MNTSPYNGTVFVIGPVLRSKRDPLWSLYSQWISECYGIWFEEILNFFYLKNIVKLRGFNFVLMGYVCHQQMFK